MAVSRVTRLANAKAEREKKARSARVSVSLKEMILHALDESGGVEYLRKQAATNPSAFMGLVSKVLPMQLQGDASNPIQFVISTGVPRAEDDDLLLPAENVHVIDQQPTAAKDS